MGFLIFGTDNDDHDDVELEKALGIKSSPMIQCMLHGPLIVRSGLIVEIGFI
jgi:hypothetical protein